MTREHDPLITNYSHLATLPRSSEALHTLRRVSTLLKPIMRQHGYRVPELAEFYPPQPNLLGLNWNHGSKICLRLRYASDQTQFLPFENVLDTMLHELAHIEHGPHNQAFHKLWDELRAELEALVAKGYSGEGFLGRGQRLGGGFGAADPVSARRRAGQRDPNVGGDAGGGSGGRRLGGRRLGGRRVGPGEDIRAVIARAAERRKEITQGCGSGSVQRDSELVAQVNANGFRTQAEEDEANDKAIMDAVMELIAQEEREDRERAAGGEWEWEGDPVNFPAAPPPVPLATKPQLKSDPVNVREGAGSPRGTVKKKAAVEEGWTCEVCTLHNEPNHLACDACGCERPSMLSPTDYRDDSRLVDLAARASTARQQTSDELGGGNRAGSGKGAGAGSKRPASSRTTDDERVLKPRSTAAQLERIVDADRQKKEKAPIGWACAGCGSFMENEWWTCSLCGRMKERS